MKPQTGDIYRHFKNKLYQIVGVAIHSETGEELVIYQALYGDFKVYARPLEMFMSEVDHEKYPLVTQKYRFEKVEREDIEKALEKVSDKIDVSGISDTLDILDVSDASGISDALEESVDRRLIEFLDADTYAEKLNILTLYKNNIDDRLINAIAASLDTIVPEGDVEERYQSLRNYVKTQAKFECNRFR